MDIVERLLSWMNYEPNDYIEPAIADIKEAAHEIERLRQQNAYLLKALKNTDEMFLPALHSLLVTNIFALRGKIKVSIEKATGGE